jgi:hypothetical protein
MRNLTLFAAGAALAALCLPPGNAGKLSAGTGDSLRPFATIGVKAPAHAVYTGLLDRFKKPKPSTGEVPAVAAQDPRTSPTAGKTGSVRSPEAQLVVYFVISGQRCSNCVKIQEFTADAVASSFSDQVKSGRMAWEVIDADLPGNAHFMTDYQLFTKSVVLVERKNGKQVRYKNLPRIWELLNDKAGFQAYIVGEARAMLGE